MTGNPMITCELVEERLVDWLEHDLDAVTQAAFERHAAGCARCSRLVGDFAAIRRQAATLPELVPSRDLWPGIEARIQAPVITLERPQVAQRRIRSAWWMGAAAAGLVAVTASVTYYLTSRTSGSSPSVAAVDSPAVRAPDTTAPDVVADPAASLATNPGQSVVPTTTRQQRPSSPSSRPAGAASEYDRDVAQLRAILAERRAELDSTTIATLEKNLDLIDRAIAESRAALQRDPASEFLADQLARAMTKKVAILRTAAMLPVRS